MATRENVRLADQADILKIEDFLARSIKLHRHLDWLTPVEWLSQPVFLILEKNNKIEALLICTAEIDKVFWIRLFASNNKLLYGNHFDQLFSRVVEAFNQDGITHPQIACIASQDWLQNLLKKRHWKIMQEVVQLKWIPKQDGKPHNFIPKGLLIRPIKRLDIPIVTYIDMSSFAPLWQHNENSIRRAFDQSAYATLCEVNGQAVGYQISTSLPTRAHIARLAVLPEFQRRRFGLALVWDTLCHFTQLQVREVTVNTQMDNTSSLSLYNRLGFRMTPERLNIFIYS